jgi:N-formylglutamate amidohydrolase
VKAAAYATTLTEYNDGRYMRCVVTDQYGSHLTTKSVSMKAVYELLITTQPQTAVVMKGDTVYFNVKARGDGLGYQWQISDDGGKTWRDSAVKAAAYATTLTSANNGRHMRCVVSDKYGNKVTSKEAVMWMSGLRITSQPVDFSGKKGDTVRISVKAAGDGLSYQWQRSDDGGKTWKASTVKAADYVVTLSNAYNGRQVRCIVTDQYGNQVTSNIASMKIA